MLLDQSPRRWSGSNSAVLVPSRTEADQADACDVEGDHPAARFFGLPHPHCFLNLLYPSAGMGRFVKVMVRQRRRRYTRYLGCPDRWLRPQ